MHKRIFNRPSILHTSPNLLCNDDAQKRGGLVVRNLESMQESELRNIILQQTTDNVSQDCRLKPKQ